MARAAECVKGPAPPSLLLRSSSCCGDIFPQSDAVWKLLVRDSTLLIQNGFPRGIARARHRARTTRAITTLAVPETTMSTALSTSASTLVPKVRVARRAVNNKMATVRCSAKPRHGERAVGSTSETLNKLMTSSYVVGGIAAAVALQAAFPEQAQAISIRDPVFGDIEVWQFLVITAGYFIGIEIYLDKKYDEEKKTPMPTVQKKTEDDKKEE